MRSEKYSKFVEQWDAIEADLVDFPDKHQKFFFDFLFRLTLSIWDNFSNDECEEIKLIASKFYKSTLNQTENNIQELRGSLPKVKLEGMETFKSVSNDIHNLATIVKLLDEILSEYEILNAYTFDEAISFLPQELNYPPNSALRILNILSPER